MVGENMLTIFTPVYNRANLIGNLYQSLLVQTDYEFEWLIIDDGSGDSIAALVESWITANIAPFEIKFYQQKNGGKHRAINRAVQVARGDAFFIVDSDDILTTDAVEMIRIWWEGIQADSRYAGIAGLRGNGKGEVIGRRPLFETYIDATNTEREQFGLLKDKAEVYKTSVLKRFPFPEFEGENFLTEAVVWDKIAQAGMKIRWYNRVIYLGEYLAGGLTSRGWQIFAENPLGWGCYIRQKCECYQLDEDERIAQYLIYYILTRDRLLDQDIMSILGIDDCWLEKVKGEFQQCIANTVRYIGAKIAVYGMGMRGKKLLKLYRDTDVSISFVLDRRQVDSEYKQINLDGTYPNVDAIIVTPEKGQNEIKEFLLKKTDNRLIGYDAWKAYVGLEKDF